jgi:mannose-6-phosphate isomerase-like protein (cupin superfamily)
MTAIQSSVLLRSEETGGAIGAIQNTVQGGWEGPPLHHHVFDEVFYVLDGELTFQLGDELVTAGRGAFVFAPGGAVHTLANRSGAPARYLLLCTPAGFERRFEPDATGPAPETIVVGPRIASSGTRRIEPVSAGVNVHVRGSESENRVAVMENVGGPPQGPPLHHHAFDELFFVLEGELTFQVGDERVTRRAGELAFAPRHVPHTFANLSGTPSRILLVCTPAGFERYFARIAAKQRGVEPPEWALEPYPEVTTVGPPLA